MAVFEQDRALMIRLWRMWGSRAAELSDEQWTTETRLPGWTVRDVYVHITPDVMIEMLAAPPADGEAKVTSAAEMLRILNADPVEAEPRHERMAETVRRLAADAERAAVATRFESEFPAAFDRIPGLSRASVIAHPFLESVALGAFLDMAILETTIHWLDVIDAVGGPPPEAMALERTRNILAAVPDPLTFVEAASGRSDSAILPVMH
ncbi:maleylpyruvate isomerase N-terminal domain-containing protein [Rhodococcus rhodochrous]|uniref:maleylpyruvate isomerase N-terminal domain-containing protein n=1 Tax=Rhodococcus rhodochrous TaxID=1829 RepID=UPI001E366EB7|nr:maleylpyruvate isomerase N-terminal domain-containing protein [Rhodococcus rhodochrous]MCD2099377.1 maleylpyruvate isomerase N-terminal domain-containing protein [Rhodococcus rhodochrous]MCD2123746.1 maleylpyruvate isomerase N-terminal domain-containing protein [Rhodococcus rhodochrous]MCQ4136353.1 maleylpyruvate isomerase N-terminal domain-containing protein [Rhodococcus rhodochrous]MDJ0020651.1 maleylpyruvate isomerase N-terminal domain-containing protein [Rhodococcus rhodochrous]